MRTLIQGGTVVTATETTEADVVIEDEKVAAIGRGMSVEADRVIDATGRYVMPGGVDVHTHMELPFGGSFCSDDFETGTRAAAFGGTTTIVDFALQDYGEGLRQGLDRWFAKAQNAVTDYGFHVIIREVNDQVLKEMDELVGEGVTSFKLFMAYPGVFMLDDASIFRAMRQAGQSGALIMMHAENGGPIDVLVRQFLDEGKTAPVNHGLTRPAVMEGEAVHRVFRLAELAETPAYIVHLSSRDALNSLREARDRGQAAYAETCPQYLYLSQDDMAKPGFEGAKYVCSPPLRTADHQEDLWMGLRGGDLSVVSTDHAPFNYTGQKDLGKDDFSKIPNGLPSVEDRFTLLYGGVEKGHIDLNRFVELVATAPAKMFGLYPRKGTIAPGSDADIVVFDATKERTISASTHHMRVDYSAYEGTGRARPPRGRDAARPGAGRERRVPRHAGTGEVRAEEPDHGVGAGSSGRVTSATSAFSAVRSDDESTCRFTPCAPAADRDDVERARRGVRDHRPGVRRPERRDRAAFVPRRVVRLVGVGQRETLDAEVRPQLRPVDLATSRHQDEHVVVRTTPDHDRPQQLAELDPLERGALLGARGALGSSHLEREPGGLGRCHRRRVGHRDSRMTSRYAAPRLA